MVKVNNNLLHRQQPAEWISSNLVSRGAQTLNHTRMDTTDMLPVNRAARRAIASNNQPKDTAANELVSKINNCDLTKENGDKL